MQRILKTLMVSFGMGVFDSYRRLSLDLLKIQAATAYVKGIQTVRRWWIGSILLAFVILLLAIGFVMVHVGFFLWVPWCLTTKAIVLLLLGLVYIGVALVVIFNICSEKAWLEGSQANKLFKDATRNS